MVIVHADNKWVRDVLTMLIHVSTVSAVFEILNEDEAQGHLKQMLKCKLVTVYN